MNSKKTPVILRCAVIILCAVICLSTVACQPPEPQPGVAETETLPDLTDDRTLTPIDTFRDRLDGAFADATPADPADLTWEDADGGVRITGYTGTSPILMLPESIDGQAVVAIADGAFASEEEAADGDADASNVALTALYIPDSVTFIGHGALKGCDSLTALRTPVVTAPGTTVDENEQLQHSFGAMFGAENHLSNALAVPKTLTTLILGEGLTTIPAYAFYACRNIVVIECPSTLQSVNEFAFYDCENLAYIDLSGTALTSVGECAFGECTSLLRFDLPSTVTSVGQGAVKGCAAMEDMTLPFIGGTPTENTYLGYLFGATDYTFAEGHLPISLMNVTLLPTGHDVPNNAFFGCTYLQSVTLPEGITTVGHRAFYGCAHLTAVTLPDSVTTVGNEAFAGCVRLQTVDLGEGLTTLGTQAFMRCLTLKEITLPTGVTAIPDSCFAGCISLATVHAPGVTTADGVGKNVYRGCDALVTAPYIPAETETVEA